jgi:4-amino-4-deoxy-L-arabinose transferase-like glycosyltransferase
MDNDSAHHADIALHMYLTGDYVSLVDHAGDYLDKPHLHFWLSAICYEIFGVTGFAYRLPSFLFTIGGIYSTYRLGKLLYNREVGKLAALVLASAFAFILANSDVRMDAILTACIAFATWQVVLFLETKKISVAIAAGLGLALGFSTKGHIAVFVPAVSALFYILYKKEWRVFFNWKWLILFAAFALFIFPVVYCYYLQFNLHPEKIIRGKDHINGVKFILLNQSIERFSGGMGRDAKQDYFFFIHSFLWAFAPWSVIAFIALVDRIKGFSRRNVEWLTAGTFLAVLLIVSFSGFKLPHYLNIIFPVSSILTAGFIIEKFKSNRWNNIIYKLQSVVSVVLLGAAAFINAWAFPLRSIIQLVVIVFFLSLIFYIILHKEIVRIRKAVVISFLSICLCFFLLNTNFYPKLLTYQGGNELAFKTKQKLNADSLYFWPGVYSSSYNFHTATLRKEFTDSVLNENKTWILYDKSQEEAIKSAGYKLKPVDETRDFEITKLNLNFLNPATREQQCTKLVIAEISK